MKDYHASVWVLHLLDVDSESKIAEKLLRHADGVIARLCSHYRSRWFVGNTEKKVTALLVGQCDAVFTQPAVVVLILSLLELEVLVLGRRLSPKIDLLWRGSHRYTDCRETRRFAEILTVHLRALRPSRPRLGPVVWCSASCGAVVWMVLRRVLLLAAVGLAISVPAALVASRLVRSFLFETRPNDPRILVLAGVVLLSAAVLAGYGPARRASRIDPVAALRQE